MPIIEARNVSKHYPARTGVRRIFGRGGVGDLLFGRKTKESFEALSDVSLSVEAGEALGIIGSNGSGKSTLLKILAGVTLPSEGSVVVQGRVASLLELGAGFHPVLTGRENIYLNAGLLGMRHAAVEPVVEQIVAFSEIGEFIDQPVDTYSSGMYVRIAFSVAVHTAPDIFLVDEVLAVGDESFQRKCRMKIGELKEQGKTILFVSHDLGLVNALCDRVLLLSRGKVIARDTAQDTIQFYLRQVGRSTGIHAMKQGLHEAIFSHGRITLFRNGKELTAPLGVSVAMASLGTYHSVASAEWAVDSATPEACSAHAEMPRLPVRMEWVMRLADGKFFWRLEMEVQRAVEIELIVATLAFPQAFAAWHCAGKEGVFPAITPSQQESSLVLVPEPKATECVIVGDTASDLSPVRVTVEALYPFVDISLENSSYMTGARFVMLTARIPADQRQLAPQRIALMEIAVDFEFGVAALAAWRAEQAALRTLDLGGWSATLRAGRIEITRDAQPVTASVHLHTELCAGSLWSLSQAYRWDATTRDGARLIARGECLRLPYDEVWALWTEAGRLRWRVTLHAREAFECQEHNATIALVPGYDHYDLGAESGAFPPFDPAVDHWIHANHDYTVSDTARASGPGLPTITLGAPACGHAFRMSALNTGYAQGARVLQAIHTPGHEGVLYFAQGEHVLFDGYIALES